MKYVCGILLASFIFTANTALGFLPAPGLSSPISNVTLKRFDGLLSVSKVNGASGYEFQYDTLSSFNSPHVRRVSTTGTAHNVYTDALLIGKKYYWRARAFNSTDTSSWSNPNNFTVFTKYELTSPANGVTGPLNPLYGLSVHGKATAIYLFEMDTLASLNSPMKVVKSQSERLCLDSAFLRFGRKFFWRATAINEYDDTLEWSPVWSYTISSQPTVYKKGTSPVDPQVVLQWPSQGYSDIEVRVDTMRHFNSGTALNYMLTRGTTRDTLRELNFGKKYYYSIRSVFGSLRSAWSDTDSFLVGHTINSPSPGQNAVLQNLILSLSWANKMGARFHVQLASDTFFKNVLLDSQLANRTLQYSDTLRLRTTYFWRVRAFHDRDTGNWNHFRFSSYSGQLQPGPPYNNAKNLDVKIKLRFRRATWASSYILEVDTGKKFGETLSDFGLRITSFSDVSGLWNEAEVLLRYGRDHVYRAFAIRNGDTSAPSPELTFATRGAPALSFPNNNYVGIGTQTNALLTGIPGSDLVGWELDTTPDFNSPALRSGSSPHVPDDFQPQYVLLELPGNLRFETKYFWRARCISSIDTGSWSAIWNFTTTQVPWLNLPVDKATNVPISAKLTWGIQGSAEDYIYQYQMGKDSEFAGTPIRSLTRGSSAEAVESCDYSTTYYWRARALHESDTSSWSEVWSFTTIAPPTLGRVDLFSPSHGSKNVPTSSVELRWYGAANAESYDIQVASDQAFNSIITSANTTSIGAIMRNMISNKTYYWRVRARAGERTGLWSLVWNFTTATAVGIPEIIEHDFNVYPNPVDQDLTINVSEKGYVFIYSVEGSLLHSTQIEKGESNVNVSHLIPGIYIVAYRTLTTCTREKIWIVR